MIRKRRGSVSLTVPIVFVIVVVMLVVVFYFLVNATLPIIYYEKINSVATRYMFVIEKFGYLTTREKNQMLDELSMEGLDKSRITLVYPKTKRGYGQPIKLGVYYNYIHKMPILGSDSNAQNKETIISVRKNSFSKIY